jgi:hypothetical protein
MHFRVKILLSNVLSRSHEANTNKACWVSFSTIVIVRGIAPSVRNRLDHVIAGSKPMNFLVNIFFTNVLSWFDKEARRMSASIRAIWKIRSITSGMRDWQHHIVA